MDGDGQTTTKFSGGLFRGVNSYFVGTAQQYLWLDCFAMGGDGQTVLNLVLAGTGTTKISVRLFPGIKWTEWYFIWHVKRLLRLQSS